MSKGLEALESVKQGYCNKCIGVCENCSIAIIEKELQTLEILKNALTIETFVPVVTENCEHSDDAVSCVVKSMYRIKQNELSKDLKAALRDWILKNACPKEVKALEIIKNKIKIKLDYSISGTKGTHYFIETQEDIIPIPKEEYDLLREVLNNEQK